ncbi:hypothetical protein KR038_007987 [Drosophila bunnanda]|nr:hypothetical protein KR038_007987 [Drosophila bunnanda]
MSPYLLAIVLALVLALGGSVEGNRTPADVGSTPYIISLRRNGVHECAGVLITAQWALTAAHCVSLGGGLQSYPPSSYTIRAGSIQRLTGGQVLPLSKIIIHKDYASSGSSGANDLALLELQTPVTLNANTRTLDLGTARPPVGAQVTYSGWGSSKPNGALSHGLQVATRQVLSDTECQQELFLEQEDLLCLSPAAEDDLSGLCTGDAGAPAVYENQLVGIASFFVSGCGSGQPDGYVDVTEHLEWIIVNSE